MRILALYDVHGNPDALDAVLADPRAAGPDAIVVGGDVVPGAFAAAALDCLEALSGDVHWVRGNGERETAAAVDGPRPKEGDNAAEMSAFTPIQGVDRNGRARDRRVAGQDRGRRGRRIPWSWPRSWWQMTPYIRPPA
jgi:hypothetical protein